MDYQNGIHCTIVCIGDRKLELNKVILRIVFLVLGVMAAFRGMDITNDTAAYYRTYQKIAYSGFAGETRMEIGYVALNVFLTHIFRDTLVGFHVLLFITSAFSYWALEQWIERHAITYGISVITFYFLSNQSYMSAIRQSVAVGIILWALMAMENLKGRKRYFVYSLFIVFATLFHKTAVVALIFPFLMKRKYTRNTTWLLMIITLVANHMPTYLVQRLTNGDTTGTGRFPMWLTLAREMINNPIKMIFGFGTGSVKYYTGKGLVSHNTFLDVLFNEGFLGFSILWCYIVKSTKKKRKEFPFTVISFVGMSVLLLTLSAFNTRFFMLVLFLIGMDIAE